MTGKRNITPQHYQHLGEIVATWARLETHIFRSFEKLLGINLLQGIAIFWEMPFRNRIDRLKSLVALRWRWKEDTRRQEFNGLMEEIDDLYFIRNLAAHSIWKRGIAENAIQPVFVNAKGGKIRTTSPHFPKLEDRDFTPARLRQEAEKIYAFAERYKQFAKLHFGVEFLHQEGDDGFD